MRSKLNCLLCFLALALPACAQLDSARLRVKFGAPSGLQIHNGTRREIFRVPPGFDLEVDYGVGNQVCKLQVPALMPTDALSQVQCVGTGACVHVNKAQNPDDMKQKMHAFLAELVPDSMRGKELGRFQGQTGAFSARGGFEYDHVRIVETYSGSNDTITVIFKNVPCQPPTDH